MESCGEVCPDRSGDVEIVGREAVPYRSDEHRPRMPADARDSGRRRAPAVALLSMGHNSSSPPPSSTAPPKPFKSARAESIRINEERRNRILLIQSTTPAEKLTVYIEGSRADFPKIPDLDPNRPDPKLKPGNPDNSRRGVITEFSPRSRTRLQRQLATMRKSEIAFTMALTLPGCDVATFSHSAVIAAFTKIFRRLSVKEQFSGVTGYWKRELQKRGALHYHLLLYGLADEGMRAEFQAWMVSQWISFFSSPLTEEQREHHRWWHSRAQNMQLVKNFSAYFSKYLGKDEDAAGGVAGRWWGSFNKRGLPVSICADAALPRKATVMLHRLARKRRQKRMEAGKHRSDSAKMEKFGILDFTQDTLARLRSGYDTRGYRNPLRARIQLACYGEIWKARGIHPGKPRFSGKAPKTAPIILCDAFAPAFAAKALEFVNRSLGLNMQLAEVPKRGAFVPDPLRPVPPWRVPRNAVRSQTQADFLDDLGNLSRMRQLQIEDDTPLQKKPSRG